MPQTLLDVTCWCESNIVQVSEKDVWEGKTKCCGLKKCKEIAESEAKKSKEQRY